MARRDRTVRTAAYTAYNKSSPPTGDLDGLRLWLSGELGRIEQAIPKSAVKSVSAAYTALPTDGVILADATDAAFTVTLPDPTRVKFMRVTVKRTNSGTNQVTIGGTIDGGVNPTLTTQYAAISLVSDGTQWLVDGVATDILGGIDPAMSPDAQPTAQTDEFTATSLDSKWSWINQGTSTAALTKGRLVLTPQITGGAGTNSARLLLQTVPAGNWAIRASVTTYGTILNCGGGLVAYRSNSGDFLLHSNLVRVTTTTTAGASSTRLLAGYWTDTSTFSTVVVDQNGGTLGEIRRWFLQMRYDGTNFYIDYSPDNVQYFNVASVNATTAIGGAPTSFGLGVNAPSASATPGTGFDYFRVYSNANLNQ